MGIPAGQCLTLGPGLPVAPSPHQAKRILLTGGRNLTDLLLVARALGHYAPTGPHLLVHGGCKVTDIHGNPYTLAPREAPGADRLAHHIALGLGWHVEVHPADWEHCAPSCPPDTGHRRTRDGVSFCPLAGPRRNWHMARLGAAGLIALPGGPGTARMVEYAERVDIPVWEPAKAQRT